MMVGACLLAIGLFWFAFTSPPTMNPWPQILAGVPIGVGVQVVLLQSLAYLIDIYTTSANSAISGTVVVRSLIGGGFPLFAIPMYQRFGVSVSLGPNLSASLPLPSDLSVDPSANQASFRYEKRSSGLQPPSASLRPSLSQFRSFSTSMERRFAL